MPIIPEMPIHAMYPCGPASSHLALGSPDGRASQQAANRPSPPRPRLRWTTGMVAWLKTRYLELAPVPQPRGRGLSVVGRLIAAETGWPARAVVMKLYHLRPELRSQQQRTARRLHASVADPVELAKGHLAWTVLLDDRHVTWLLDYPYGDFPFLPGQRCRVAEVLYRIERVGTSQISVARLEDGAYQPVAEAALAR